jgi:hypothetical protein
LTGAALLYLAVGVLTKNFSRTRRMAFVLCALGLLAQIMIIFPGIFGFFGLSEPIVGESLDRLLRQTVLVLHVCGYAVFGACTGYFLLAKCPA